MSVATEAKQHLEAIDPFVRKLLVGSPSYVDDVRIGGRVAYFGLVRSQYANAMISKVDASKIREDKRLFDLITGEDLARQGIGGLPIMEMRQGEPSITRGYLASQKVTYVGEPIASVLSDDLYTVEDLLEQVSVEYEVLPPVGSLNASKAATSAMYDSLKDNLLFHTKFARDAPDLSVGRGISEPGQEAENGTPQQRLHRGESRFRVNRQAAVPIETRSVIASYDAAVDSFTVYSTVQQPDSLRDTISKVLKIPSDRISVKKSTLGGAFGAKGAVPYTEAFLACLFAKRNPGIVAKWVSNRTEDLLESVQGRDKLCEIELSCDDNAKIVSLKAKIEADVGAFEAAPDGNFSILSTARLLPGVYRIPSVSIEAFCYATHKIPSGPIRDTGKTEACYFMECAIDAMARHLRLDPIDFRRRNLIMPEEFPYDNGAGCVYDSGRFPSLLQRLLQASDYESLKAWRTSVNNEFARMTKEGKSPASMKLAGIGISLAIEENSVLASSSGKEASRASSKRVNTFAAGAHLCALLMDSETGTVEIVKYVVVDDYGPALNVAYADGRIHGGLGREIGAAFLEEARYDEQAQPLNPTLMDYLIPTAETVPNVISVHCDTPSPLTENGTKGLGEIGTMGVVAAVANAINDALSFVGLRPIGIVPISPEDLWVALHSSPG
ncbi:MAG TPA: molybdopterin cofactor-binding domain-containing protein [Nitrososphaerales archaeon]|nr:molybdopterin cofactor-binding domain-containing protein [Nitrososphaerales archaeon]